MTPADMGKALVSWLGCGGDGGARRQRHACGQHRLHAACDLHLPAPPVPPPQLAHSINGTAVFSDEIENGQEFVTSAGTKLKARAAAARVQQAPAGGAGGASRACAHAAS